VPILAYHVINTPPPSSSVPRNLYVPAAEFAAQMQALKAGGWHAVTLDQLRQYWARGTAPASGKPLVLTFDDGYASQYTNALPVLKALGWAGVADLQINGLPPSDGGLAPTQVRGLTAAGWELDLEGSSQAGLTNLGSAQLLTELQSERQTLQSTYGAPVNWLTYPGGSYNPTLTAAARQAGFIGAMTVVAGWATPQGDRFRLPRLQVLSGTTPSQLLSQIAAAQANTSIPASASGP
jgi:peptidoglycan/xylan/chitin deacetylase (PgdA/CDA1 family)